MNADIIINDSGPGLVPFGCFDVILPALRDALSKYSYLDESEIMNEWRGELYLDGLASNEFNGIIEIICNYLSMRQAEQLNSEVFIDFWNNLILPAIKCDIRYKGACEELK